MALSAQYLRHTSAAPFEPSCAERNAQGQCSKNCSHLTRNCPRSRQLVSPFDPLYCLNDLLTQSMPMRIALLLPTIAPADQRGSEFCARLRQDTCAEHYSIASATIGRFRRMHAVSERLGDQKYLGIYRVAITEILMKLLSSCSSFLSFPYQTSNWKTRASLDWYP
ncbi:hypothetical protein BDR03DRAFT_603901 [Suillus americanus]|nr:hypothetical protein BDR03DRAFT_603901 [Suillus americanus]